MYCWFVDDLRLRSFCKEEFLMRLTGAIWTFESPLPYISAIFV